MKDQIYVTDQPCETEINEQINFVTKQLAMQQRD